VLTRAAPHCVLALRGRKGRQTRRARRFLLKTCVSRLFGKPRDVLRPKVVVGAEVVVASWAAAAVAEVAHRWKQGMDHALNGSVPSPWNLEASASRQTEAVRLSSRMMRNTGVRRLQSRCAGAGKRRRRKKMTTMTTMKRVMHCLYLPRQRSMAMGSRLPVAGQQKGSRRSSSRLPHPVMLQ